MNTLLQVMRGWASKILGGLPPAHLQAKTPAPLGVLRLDNSGQHSVLYIDVDHLIMDADRIDLAPEWSRRRKPKNSRRSLPVVVGGTRRKELPPRALALKNRRMKLASIQEGRRLAKESHHALHGNQPL